MRKANEVLRAIGIEDAVDQDESGNNEGYSFMYDPTTKIKENQNEQQSVANPKKQRNSMLSVSRTPEIHPATLVE
jgi:hypothetical protein